MPYSNKRMSDDPIQTFQRAMANHQDHIVTRQIHIDIFETGTEALNTNFKIDMNMFSEQAYAL